MFQALKNKKGARTAGKYISFIESIVLVCFFLLSVKHPGKKIKENKDGNESKNGDKDLTI